MRHLTTQLGLICASLMLSASGAWALPKCPTDPNAFWSNCVGTFTSSNGVKYVGEFKDDKPNGQGTYTWPNGDKYVGEFKDGKAHGQGTDTFASGNIYVGEFKDDKRNGQGTFTYANGNIYVGEWLDDKANGQGTFTYADGTIKEGIWENGVVTLPAEPLVVSETNPFKIKGVGLGQAEATCTPREITYVDILQKPVRIQMQCTLGSPADRVTVVFSIDGQSVVRVTRNQYLMPSDPEPGEIVKAAVGFYGAPNVFDEGNWLANYGNAFSYDQRNVTMNSSGTGLLINGYLCGDGRYGTADCGDLGTRLIRYDLIDVEAFNNQVKDGELAQQEKDKGKILKQEF